MIKRALIFSILLLNISTRKSASAPVPPQQEQQDTAGANKSRWEKELDKEIEILKAKNKELKKLSAELTEEIARLEKEKSWRNYCTIQLKAKAISLLYCNLTIIYATIAI